MGPPSALIPPHVPMTLHSRVLSVSGHRSLQLYHQAQTLMGRTSPKAIVILLPDLGSHVQLMSGFAHTASAFGYEVFGLEFCGFGRSDGERGLITNFEELVNDLVNVAKSVIGEKGRTDIPLFVMAEGRAATIALAAALRDESLFGENRRLFTQLYLLSPLLEKYYYLSYWSSLLRSCLIQLWGAVSFLCPYRYFAVQRLLPLCKSYSTAFALAADPLINAQFLTQTGLVHSATARELSRLQSFVDTNIEKLQTPFVVLYGQEDLTIFPKAYYQLAQRTESIPKKLKRIIVKPNSFHFLMLESCWPSTAQFCVNLMEDRVESEWLLATLD